MNLYFDHFNLYRKIMYLINEAWPEVNKDEMNALKPFYRIKNC